MNNSAGKKSVRIMICAGEVSGELYAANIMQVIKHELGNAYNIEFFGIGGDKMVAEGAEIIAHVSQTGVMGLWEVLKRVRFFTKLKKQLQEMIDIRKPDILFTIDYPGMNMRIAEYAHNKGIKTIHFICPQVWAWHQERIPKIATIFDHLITIFPFEVKLFDEYNLDCRFLGHPMVDVIAATKRESSPELPWKGGYRIALFPGSRRNEIARLLPDILKAATLVEKELGECSFIIPTPTKQIDKLVRSVLAKCKIVPKNLELCSGNSRHVLQQSIAAIIKSGTSTLEAALMECPHIVIYKVSKLTEIIARRLIKGVKNVGIVNIVADKEITPELLQDAVTPERMAAELIPLIKDGEARTKQLAELQRVCDLLGEDGAILRTGKFVSEKVLEVVS
ncbi:MAG: lipid-A-disaccharide synthase [Kiritimatiellae bacterium]|nr:lipid-A-disaccharide synthase [Kiritimatiellia bacterium]